MGCDIHTMLEYKKNEKYISYDVFEINEYYKQTNDERPFECKAIYSDRNYFLFGQLANVRARNVNYISKPRGIPKDSCKVILDYIESWGDDGHSHSYFSLSELEKAIKAFSPNNEGLKTITWRITKQFQEIEQINRDLTKEEKDNLRLVFFFDN